MPSSAAGSGSGSGTGSILKVGATSLNVRYQRGDDALLVEIRRPARPILGIASLRICSHLPISENSRLLKPVALPPGFDMLCTKPWPSGSDTPTNTIGMVRVSLCTGRNALVGPATITSGLSCTSSRACAVGSGPPKRSWTRALAPSVHPSRCNSWTKAVTRRRTVGLSRPPISTAMSFVLSRSCARPDSGQAAAPPNAPRKSRLLIRLPRRR